jgi:hypothetical protein
MSWINKIFQSDKEADNKHLSHEEEMLVKLENSISQCSAEIKKAGDETEQISKWTIEAITEVFHVPNKLWYQEISKYDEIKSLEENKVLDQKVIHKCDEVVFGYSEQIKLREAKIVLYNTLIEKYNETKEKLEKIKKRSEDEQKAQEKLQLLEKHSQRIDLLRNSPENLNAHIEGTNHLEILENEAKEVIDEFEISEEVKSSLDEINVQFNAGRFEFGIKSAIDEIEKLVQKIKKQEE